MPETRTPPLVAPPAAAPQADPETIGRLRLATLRLARRLRQNAAPGVTPSQLSVLNTLGRHGPMTLGDLAAHESVQPPSVTRMVAALEEQGLVKRASSPSDRRAVVATLTPKGARAVEDIRRRRDAWLAQRLAVLSPADLAALEAALPVLEELAGEPPRPGLGTSDLPDATDLPVATDLPGAAEVPGAADLPGAGSPPAGGGR